MPGNVPVFGAGDPELAGADHGKLDDRRVADGDQRLGWPGGQEIFYPMPWSNQSGGLWGSGPRGPWGSGPQQQGPRPPDLEEFLRRSQDRLRTFLPGNLGGSGKRAGWRDL